MERSSPRSLEGFGGLLVSLPRRVAADFAEVAQCMTIRALAARLGGRGQGSNSAGPGAPHSRGPASAKASCSIPVTMLETTALGSNEQELPPCTVASTLSIAETATLVMSIRLIGSPGNCLVNIAVPVTRMVGEAPAVVF